jgi:predicted NUDIX family NTP pyrophosphohydrolase
MAHRTSAGILLFRQGPAGREVLLAHPGGPYFARKDAGHWTIPKGEPDGDTDLLRVARREFEEEIGIAPPEADPVPLGTVTQKGGKVVHAWAIEGDVDPAEARSNAFEMEWPPRSGRRASFPEVDRVAWFDLAEARRRIKSTQIPFLERLEGVQHD